MSTSGIWEGGGYERVRLTETANIPIRRVEHSNTAWKIRLMTCSLIIKGGGRRALRLLLHSYRYMDICIDIYFQALCMEGKVERGYVILQVNSNNYRPK